MNLVIHEVNELQDVHVSNGDRRVKRLAGAAVVQRHLPVEADQALAVGRLDVQVLEDLLPGPGDNRVEPRIVLDAVPQVGLPITAEQAVRSLGVQGRAAMVGLASAATPVNMYRDLIGRDAPEFLANGGSCLAGPDGEWVVEPVIGKEKLIVATLDHQAVLRERQNFDPSGHYARPDVTQLNLNRQRQSTLKIVD